ncbi:alpha-L-fucosidase [Paraferrimonas sp. SM1919]|uniref:alpha-L-fucosidase n=1 Tax=Paraferrimonas sp. SM1919 TaxID=2662263 RepID=UPI0013D0EDC7|nr:alpha-L-fucosidase [Paraferrimonas sp. SM1919]
MRNLHQLKSLAVGVALALATACEAAPTSEIPKAFNERVHTPQYEERMQWFRDAKLGIFIHWGIYAVNGISESWSLYTGMLPYEEYMKQLDGFTAHNYDPKYWAQLIKGSGAKYAVVTSKHHDGVSLWDSKAHQLTTANKTPAKRDVLTPLINEFRNHDLKVGLYYSLMDWSHKDFPTRERNVWAYQPKESPQKWQKFLDFNFQQYRELAEQYNPDLWWFDGQWWLPDMWQSDKTAKMLREYNPNVIINSRLPGQEDYETPEQGVPLASLPNDIPWELCTTMNDSWGYQPTDTNYKTPKDIIDMFTDTIGLGGNLLLDIGPKPDGTIPAEQEAILKGLGRWVNKHEKAIFNTRKGVDYKYFHGPSTIGSAHYQHTDSEDEILYLFVQHKPNGSIRLKGLESQIVRAWVVGNGQKVPIRRGTSYKTPGIVYMNVPETALDQDVTVIAIRVAGKVKMQKEDYHAG